MFPYPLTHKPAGDHAELLQSLTAQVMRIEDTTRGDNENYAVRFRGQLLLDSMEAYATLSEKFRALYYTPFFRKEGETHVIYALRGVIAPTPSKAWVNYLMFGLTVLSVLVTGGILDYTGEPPRNPLGWLPIILSGWPFVLSMLGILLAHELGHYFMARRHNLAVTLPYFIPLPLLSPFGTMGAVIQLKSPPTNKRVLLDVGIAGPLAGFIVAVPVLIYGLLTSPVKAITPGGGFEGNSILYVALKYLLFGKLLPEPVSFGNLPQILYMLRYYLTGLPRPEAGLDVYLNSIAWAGWGGLLVTGLNLIPAGQLDGGHALYVLIGSKARRVVPFIIAFLVAIGFLWNGWWLWAAIIYFVGRTHAEPLDQITELDPRRKVLAILALVMFALVITPIPMN